MQKPSTFAERLKEALDIKQITKAELSRITGINKSSLTRYVKGSWEGKQDAVYEIAKALDVNEAWLMGYDVPMDRMNVEAMIQAEAEHRNEIRAFLENHSGVIIPGDRTNNVGCSIHCNSDAEMLVMREIFLQLVRFSAAEQTDKLVVLNELISNMIHMPIEKFYDLRRYSEFLKMS